MNRLGIEPLALEKVRIQIHDIDEGVIVSFTGNIDMRDPVQDLLPYLILIHEEVHARRLVRLVADFTRLSFMNSSGIRCLISWIMKVNDLEPGARYAMTIQYNPRITWQESSIKVLNKLFAELIHFVPVLAAEEEGNPF